MLVPIPYGMQCPLPAGHKDRQADAQINAAACGGGGGGGNYDVPTSMFPIPNANFNNQPPPFVILPRADLEFLKQEVTSLRNSMVEFQTVVSGEIQKLRVESEALQRLVQNQKCFCKDHGYRNVQNSSGKRENSQWQQCKQCVFAARTLTKS